jgi:hypothetical protein
LRGLVASGALIAPDERALARRRILGTSEIRHEDWPTTEEVLERGTDISDKVVRYLVAISR